ncbi:Uncharacterized protein SCF082_LOCUS12781 [Durusdinium trenchii]|uniref:Uncharacterized protein n=1 Tax=Durusdinium trenchii TaxID=1381693 RepID=A0ABP0JM87_9DINO
MEVRASAPRQFAVHLNDLSWDEQSSPKPPPFRTQSELLLDEFLTNGCVTQTDPLQVWEAPDSRSTMTNQWVSYVKGAARSATMLFLASFSIRYHWDFGSLFPELQRSMCAIHCRRGDCASDIASNAKECAAESITKQHCALTWLGKLNLVKNRDAYTPTELIKDWNRTAIEFLLGHLNEFGSQGNAFSETVWASKKIMPGGGPRGFPKEWNARLTMTSEAFMLLLRYVDAQRRSKLEGARVKAELVQQFLEGHMNLELELQNALSQEQSNFKPADIPLVKGLMAKHAANADDEMANLRNDIALSQIRHDIDVYRVWLTRSRDREAAVYHQAFQWKISRQSRAKDLADAMLTRASEHWRIEMSELENANSAARFVNDCMRQILKLEQLKAEDLVAVVLLNWESCQKLLGQNNINLDGVAVLPYKGRCDDRSKRSLVHTARVCFTLSDDIYKLASEHFAKSSIIRKPLWKEAELPSSKELLTIEDMSDCALPSSTDASTHPSQAEKNQQIGVAAARNIIKAVLKIENSASVAAARSSTLIVDLTVHTCDFSRAAALEKDNQFLYYLGLRRNVGEEEWSRTYMKEFLTQSLLEGAIPGVTLPPEEVPADLKETSPPLPTLNALVLNKQVKVDGLVTLKAPDKVLASWGEHPAFGPEFWQVINEARSTLPLDVTDSKKRDSDGLPLPPGKLPKHEATGTPKKEETKGEAKAEIKEAIKISEMPTPLTWEASLNLSKTKGQVSLVITLGSRIWLVNRGPKDVILHKNHVIAGFHAGKWWHKANAQDGVREVDILHDLANASTLVQCNGTIETLGEVIKAKRSTNPDVTVQYHHIKDAPADTDPAFFQMERDKSIYFQVQEIPAKSVMKDAQGKACVSFDKMAGCISFDKWSTPFTEMIWVVKWSPTAAKGLVPFRPIVILTRDVSVPPDCAIELSGSSAAPAA